MGKVWQEGFRVKGAMRKLWREEFDEKNAARMTWREGRSENGMTERCGKNCVERRT